MLVCPELNKETNSGDTGKQVPSASNPFSCLNKEKTLHWMCYMPVSGKSPQIYFWNGFVKLT